MTPGLTPNEAKALRDLEREIAWAHRRPSHAAIGEALGLHEATIAKYERRALLKLRKACVAERALDAFDVAALTKQAPQTITFELPNYTY